MRVLIVRVGALGDVLHALPAVTALHRERPRWQIDWVVDPRWVPLLIDPKGRGPVVERVLLAETKQWLRAPFSWTTLRSILNLRRELRAQRYDLVVDMQGTLRSAVIGRMAGAKRFAGYSDPRERLAAFFYKQAITRRGAHVVEQGAALLGNTAKLPLSPTVVELPRDTASEDWADGFAAGRKLCVLAPGAGWAAKRWPATRFGELAQRLEGMGFAVVVNASSSADALAAEVVVDSAGAARLAVCDVAGLIALLRRAELLVGGDSGPLHLAAALGIPTVALFGPTDPERNGPWGPAATTVLRDSASITSYKRSAGLDPGLARIQVDAVVQAVKRLLAEPPGASLRE